MSFSFFPNVFPRNVNPSWFQADNPVDEEQQLTQQEQEHQSWLNSIATKDNDILPIGKTNSEPAEEEDEEEDEEEHDESSLDEVDSDVDVDSFSANGPNFNREIATEGPPRIGNLTMDLSE